MKKTNRRVLSLSLVMAMVATLLPNMPEGVLTVKADDKISPNVSDLVQIKVGDKTQTMDLYMNGVYETKLTGVSGSTTAKLVVNGEETDLTETFDAGDSQEVYVRLQDGDLKDSVDDHIVHTAAFTGDFYGLEFVDADGTRYDINSWTPGDPNGELDYVGGGLYSRTFSMKELAEDVSGVQYKVAFDDGWDYSIGLNGGSDNIAVTVPKGTTTFTVICDEINKKVYDSVRTPAFKVAQNSGEIEKSALSTSISLIGTARGGDGDWDAAKTGYEFTPITDKLYIYSKTFNKGKYEYKCVFDYANWYEAEAGNRSLDIKDDNTNVVFLYNTETGKLTDSINNANDVAVTLGMQAAPAEAKVNANANGTLEFVTVADGAKAVTLVYGKKAEVEKKGETALSKVSCKKLDNGGFSSGNIFLGDDAADIVYYYDVDGTPVRDGSADDTAAIDGAKYSVYKKAKFEGRGVNVPGTFPGSSWDAASNVMKYKGNGLYEYTFENVPAANYEYKISMGSWSENYGKGGIPDGANIAVTVPKTQDVTVFYNDITHNSVTTIDYIFADITLSGSGIPDGTKLDDSGLTGIYTAVVAMKKGTYDDVKLTYNNKDYKFDSIKIDEDKDVTFYFDPVSEIYYCNASNEKVEEADIYYNTKDTEYKSVYGAVATGEDVTFSITTGTDVTNAKMVIKGVEAKNLEMTKAGAAKDGKQKWSVTTKFSTIGENHYYFALSNGSSVVIYADDDGNYGTGKVTDLTNIQDYDLVVYKDGFETPDWMKDAVIYQIFPDRFYDGDSSNNQAQTSARGEEDYEYIKDWYTLPENPEQEALLDEDTYKSTGAYYGDGNWSNEIYGGDLKGITERIDYLKALGVNVIYLNPVFSSISSHRYDTSDYGIIDPILGDLGDFEELTQVAEANGMHVVLDGVFNHVSDDSKYFDRYYKYLEAGTDKIGAYPYWAYVYDTMSEQGVSQDTAEDMAKKYFADNYGITDFSYTEWFDVFTTSLKDDNGDAVTDDIGLRAGKAVYGYDGWWGYDSMPIIKATNGSEYQTGNWAEEIIGNDDGTSVGQYWISKGSDGWRLDVANEVSDETWQNFRKSVKALNNGDAVIIGEIWTDATDYLLGDMYDSVMNYVFRNAVLGYAKGGTATDATNALERIRERYPEEAFYAMMNLVGSHDTARVLSYLDGIDDDRNQKDIDSAFPTYEKTSDLAKRRQYLVAFLQFTYAGAPTIYYGDEIGMVGADDPDDRRAFEWGKGNKELVTWYATLADIRSQYPALRTGSVEPLNTGNDAIMGYVRSDDKDTMLVLANNTEEAKTITVDAAALGLKANELTDIIASQKYSVTDGKVTVTVPALNGVILTDDVKTASVDQAALAPAYDPIYVIAERTTDDGKKDDTVVDDPKQDDGKKDDTVVDDTKKDDTIADTKTPSKDNTTATVSKVNWANEVDTIKNAPAKDTIVVKMDETGIVSKDAIEAIKGTDKKLVIDMGDGIKWIIKGSDVAKVPTKDINMSVTVGSKNVPENIIKSSNVEKDAKKVVQISLGHDGEFGFKPVLSIDLGKEYAGKYANLYYYNKDKKSLEGQMSVKIADDGTALLTFEHASDYVISVTEKAAIDTTKKSATKTRDDNDLVLYMNLMGLAAAAIAAGAYRKKKTCK